MASAHAVDSFDAFAESFMQDNVLQAPYFHKFKSYWEHWDEPNVHHICYEKLHEVRMEDLARLVSNSMFARFRCREQESEHHRRSIITV